MPDLRKKILQSLVPGCAPLLTIYNDVRAYATSFTCCEKALNQLMSKEGLIQSINLVTPGAKIPKALYGLTENGADHLAVHYNYDRDQIRPGLPPKNMIAHELGVTDIVKAILWEMVIIPYICQYFDDLSCKRNKAHLELMGWIPDLLVRISEVKGIPCRYYVAIELDMGSRKLADVLYTLRNRNCMTLFICSVSSRILKLQNELVKYNQLEGMVYFALLSDFCSRPGGIFSTDWQTLSGRIVSLYP